MDNMTRRFTLREDVTGAKITPTPKIPVEVSCMIDIRAIEYDSLCAVDHAWDYWNGCAGSEAQDAILEAACKAFRKNFKKAMNAYVYAVNISHPTFAFGGMFLLDEDTHPKSQYGVSVFLYGKYVGYCYIEDMKLWLSVDVPRWFLHDDTERFDGVLIMDDDRMTKATPLNMRPINKKFGKTVKFCRKWVKAVARDIAEDIGYKCCGYTPEDYPYKSFISDGFVYLITELCMNYISTLPDVSPDTMMKLISRYRFVVHTDDGTVPLYDSLICDAKDTTTITVYDSECTLYDEYSIDDTPLAVGGINVVGLLDSSPDRSNTALQIYRSMDGINTDYIGGLCIRKDTEEENAASWKIFYSTKTARMACCIGRIYSNGAYEPESGKVVLATQTDMIDDIISSVATYISSEYTLEYAEVCSILVQDGHIRDMISNFHEHILSADAESLMSNSQTEIRHRLKGVDMRIHDTPAAAENAGEGGN